MVEWLYKKNAFRNYIISSVFRVVVFGCFSTWLSREQFYSFCVIYGLITAIFIVIEDLKWYQEARDIEAKFIKMNFTSADARKSSWEMIRMSFVKNV